MFKAFDIAAGADVISLNASSPEQLDDLRTRGRADQLLCPGCRQPVWFRAGEIYRAHFSHRIKSACPYGKDSAALLTGRAILYDWLRTKFPTGVTVERTVPPITEGYDLPRPVDCWVDLEDRSLAYWVFDKGVGPDKRQRMFYGVDRSRVAVTAVYLSSMLSRLEYRPKGLDLSKTERAALEVKTDFDRMQDDWGDGSLHYLDPKAIAVTTFRAVHIHRCAYQGSSEHTTRLDQLDVCQQSGTVVHPGESARMAAWRHGRKGGTTWGSGTYTAHDTDQGAQRETPTPALPPVPTPPEPAPDEPLFKFKVGKCIRCGTETDDWSYRNPDGSCLCNPCMRMKRVT